MVWISGMNVAINYIEENLGLLGISTCNNMDEWRYYIAVATTKEADDLEEYIVPACTWAIFSKESPISGM